MSDTITDLDALVPSDKKVTLGGRIYTVPGDIPMEVFVKVQLAGLQEDSEDEVGAVTTMVDALTDLFTVVHEGQPNYEELRTEVESVLRKRGVRTIGRMLRAIYSNPEPAPEADAPTPPEAG